jgi:hypothetical protein
MAEAQNLDDHNIWEDNLKQVQPERTHEIGDSKDDSKGVISCGRI